MSAYDVAGAGAGSSDATPSALAERLRAGGTAYGAMCTLGEEGARALLGAGFDFVLLDCQHGSFDEGTVGRIIRRWGPEAPAAFVVRVSKLDDALIGRVLDAGADGVVVPMVNTPSQAAAAVAACRYPPNGIRSFGPRPDLGIDLAQLEGRVSCFVMIETQKAMENLDAIVGTPGIEGVMVGPIDLSISLGVSPADALTSATTAKAMAEVVEACRRHGVVPGVFGFHAAHAQELTRLGFRFMTAGGDGAAIRATAQSELSALRGDGPAD